MDRYPATHDDLMAIARRNGCKNCTEAELRLVVGVMMNQEIWNIGDFSDKQFRAIDEAQDHETFSQDLTRIIAGINSGTTTRLEWDDITQSERRVRYLR